MIKFFAGDELYNYLNDDQACKLDDMFNNDSDITIYDGMIFYFEQKENELFSKYPEIKELIEEESQEYDEFISWQYGNGEDSYVSNEMIRIDENFLHDLTNAYIHESVFQQKFMNDPKTALEEMKKANINYATTQIIGEMLLNIKNENINIDYKVIEDISNIVLTDKK